MLPPHTALDHPARLAALQRLHTLDSRLETGIARLVRIARQHLHAPCVLFTLVGRDGVVVKASQGLPHEIVSGTQLPMDFAFCRGVVATGRPLVIADARAEPEWRSGMAVAKNGFVSCLAVPVKCVEGHVVGVFSALDTSPRQWTQDEVRLMTELVELLGPLSDGTQANAADARLRHALDVISRQQFALDQHAIVAVTDLEGRITYANDKFCEISGYSREELIGQSHRLIKSGVHPQEFFAGMWATISQRKVWHGEICNRAKDGRLYWVHSTIVPFVDQDGNLEQYVSIRSDVTSLKRMTEELRFSQERLASIIEAMSDGLVVRDSSGCVINANQSAMRILGLPRERVMGATFSEGPLKAIHENGMPWTPEDHPFMKALRSGESSREQIMGVHRVDGSLIWISINTQPIRDVNNRVIAVVSNFTDITQRLKADRALRDSEALLRTFVEHAPAAVAMFDRQMRYLVASRQWYADFRLSQKSIIGMTHYDVFPEMPERWREDYSKAMQGEVVQADADLFTRSDGSKQWLSYEIRPWLHMDGVIGGLVMFSRDITAIKQAEAERAQFEQKLMETQKLESLGVLAGGIAHDFNNILTGIVGNTSLAQLKLPEDSPVKQQLEGIAEASQRAADLIRQMLAYSGRGRFIVKKHDMSRIVDETTQLLTVSISKKARLRFELARELPPVSVDASQISQVVMNLVMNASEAIGDQPGEIHVVTGIMAVDQEYLDVSEGSGRLQPGDYIYVAVRDTGCGIPQENLKRIFEPFFTTKFTGRGLGLAAVLGIVRGHGGLLRVTSEVGKGTEFRMLLPKADGTCDPASRAPFAKDDRRLTGKVLVVDDEETVLAVVTRLLKAIGCEVLMARDGLDGVEQYRQHGQSIDLVLLDLTMPKLDGAQVYEELRRLNPGVSVVLMSGYSQQEATARFSDMGLTGFIQKPFDISILRRAVAGAFAESAQKQRG